MSHPRSPLIPKSLIWSLCALLLLVAPIPLYANARLDNTAGARDSLAAPRAEGGSAIDSCREINAPGFYQLVTNLQDSWSCIAIAANNVTLDCDHKSIAGKNFLGPGILVKRYGPPPGLRPENIEIRNCKIFNHQYGILVEEGRNIRVLNNNLSNNFDDTHGSYFGPWMGAMDGGGLRMNQTQDGLVQGNTSNRSSNGIDLRDSERIIVQNNETTMNSGFGILLWNTSHSRVVGNTANDNSRWCTITDGQWKNWVVQGCDTAAIMLQDGSNYNEIADNTLIGQNGDGIFIRAHGGMRCGDGNRVINNRIYGAIWNSIEVGFCNGVLISGNYIERSKIGVWISFMDNVQILDNTFVNVDTYGIALKDSPKAQVRGNVFRDSPEGVYVFWDPSNAIMLRKPLASYASHSSNITGNSFHNMRTAGIHFKDSTRNFVNGNRFENVPTPYWLEGDASHNLISP